MVNINATLQENTNTISLNNRGFNYGDAVFETIKVSNTKILFWEDHYFRLMASMRIMRMEIPMNFTMEYLESEILKTIKANNSENKTVRIKFLVSRSEGGLYHPDTNNIDFYISVKVLEQEFYSFNNNSFVVDLFKDFFVAPGLLSTLKTNNKALNILASIYAKENDFNNCLLLNTNKNIVEALNGNLFLVKGTVIKTPPLLDGCLNGVMRKQLMEIIKLLPDYTLEEASISPFELQKADELFITNVITGIQPITNYRKKSFNSEVANLLLQKINIKIRLG
jgi:branched-chain amino acid aminotransferase